MIRFSCMYCGRKIRAKGRSVGKKARCPACGHALLIPKRAEAAEGSDAEGVAPVAGEKAEAWEGMSDKQIARLLLKRNRPVPGNEARVAAKAAASPLLPRYDELTLFVLSVALLMLLAINRQSQVDLPEAMMLAHGGHITLLLGAAGIGMIFSLFGIFFTGPKPDIIKWPMLIFAVSVTAGTGIYAGYVAIENARSWLLIFPAWNIINGALLLLLAHAGLLDTDCIVDGAAKLWQVVVALVCVGVLLGVCEYIFKLHWAITYSVCVGYTMGLHHTITGLFGAPAIEED